VQAAWQKIERNAFAAVQRAEDSARPLTEARSRAELLRGVSDRLIGEFLEALRELDRDTEQRVAELPPLDAAGQSHWTALNAPIGLTFQPEPAAVL